MTHTELAFMGLAILLPIIGGGILFFVFAKMKPPPGA
jgi:hypothetical protein